MQQQTIVFDEVRSGGTVDVRATIRQKIKSVNLFLDSRSEFYSRMLEEDITWRKGLRVGVVLPCLLIAVAVCALQALLVTVVCLASAGWIVYRLNKEDRKGGEA